MIVPFASSLSRHWKILPFYHAVIVSTAAASRHGLELRKSMVPSVPFVTPSSPRKEELILGKIEQVSQLNKWIDIGEEENLRIKQCLVELKRRVHQLEHWLELSDGQAAKEF